MLKGDVMHTVKDKQDQLKHFLELSNLSVEDYLTRAIPVFHEHLNLIRASNSIENINILIQGLDGLKLILEYVHSASEAYASDSTNVSRNFLTIAKKLQEDFKLIVEAMEKKDSFLLADVIEFELIDSLESLKKLINIQCSNK